MLWRDEVEAAEERDDVACWEAVVDSEVVAGSVSVLLVDAASIEVVVDGGADEDVRGAA